VLRAAVDRTAAEWVTAMLCALVAIAQISALWNSPILGTLQSPAFLAAIGDIIRFVGSFLVGRKEGDYFLAGAVMLALSGVAAFGVRDHLDRYFVLLLAMFVGACMVSTARLPMNIISPFFAGPRYFFYPFVLITWAGIWLAANSAPWFRMALLIAYVAAVGFAAPLMSWRHIAIDWRAHVALCAKMDGLELPVLWWNASPLEIHWRQFLGRECRTFIDQSLFPMPATSREE